MRFVVFAAIVLSCIAIGRPVSAGEFNKQLNVGDRAPSWTDLPGTDDKKHSLSELANKDVVVLAFTCNSCPVAVGYEDRLLAFARKHTGPNSKVALVAVNVNTIPEDRLDKMKERAKEKNFTFQYLYDESQKIARDYGANYTPEFFVLNRERRVVYMGAMDDRSNAADAKVSFLEAAVEATLKGEKLEKGETLARGCRIRFARDKR